MRKLSIRVVMTLAVTGLLMALGFGCKGMTTEQQQATKAVALEWWTVYDDVDAMQDLIAQYKQLRPYITVNIRQLRADEFYQRLIEALADDSGPDIISVSNRDLKKYVSKLTSMPASVPDTTVVVTKGQLGTNTTVNIGSVSMVTLDQLDREYVQTVKKDVVVGGRIYGLPLSLDTMALYYNKDLLDRAGIAEPPKTWDDFQAAVKKITRYNKETNKISQAGVALGTGNNIPGADDLVYLLANQSNIPFVTDNGQATFNAGDSSAMMGVLIFYTDFANSTRDTYSWNEDMGNALDQFVNGSLGFFFGYSYHLPIIRGRAPQLNFGILPMLQLSSDVSDAKNAANYSIETVVGKSAHPSEAWALINYLAHSQANGTYLEKTNRPTALRAYISRQNESLDLQPFMTQILVAKNWYHGRNYEAAVRAVSDLCHDWLNPPANLADKKIDQYRQDLLNIAANKINQTL